MARDMVKPAGEEPSLDQEVAGAVGGAMYQGAFGSSAVAVLLDVGPSIVLLWL
jgi:hypothetical protein